MFPPAPFFCAICAPCQSPGPHSPSSQPSWLASLKSERESTLRRIGYSGGVFSVAQLAWTQRAFIQPQMHPYDRYFYDAVSGKYTVRRYLDDLTSRYGGIDAVLMWPTYTNLGVDDRNQFDFFRTMPGGLDSVSRVTKELKAAGVRVLWPYNPWDEGTRREPLDDARTIAMLLNQVCACCACLDFGLTCACNDTLHSLLCSMRMPVPCSLACAYGIDDVKYSLHMAEYA